MNLLQLARFKSGAATEACGRRQRGGRTVELAKAPLDLGNYWSVLDGAGRREHHVWPAIVACEIGAQVRVPEGAHGVAGAEDRPADRLVRKRRRLQIVEHE